MRYSVPFKDQEDAKIEIQRLPNEDIIVENRTHF